MGGGGLRDEVLETADFLFYESSLLSMHYARRNLTSLPQLSMYSSQVNKKFKRKIIKTGIYVEAPQSMNNDCWRNEKCIIVVFRNNQSSVANSSGRKAASGCPKKVAR